MQIRHRLWTWLWAGLLVPAIAGLVLAQAPTEPGSGAQPPAAPTPSVLNQEDPLVQAILDSKPTTPLEMLRAARVLADMKRPELAKDFFRKVLAANVDAQQRIAIVEEVGPEVFLELGRRSDVAPEGRQLANDFLGAVAEQAQDPARIAEMVGKLQDPSPETRYAALRELQKSQGLAVVPMIAVLADPSRAAEHRNVHAALVQLGPDAVRPLFGVLDATEPNLVTAAIRVLGDLKDRAIILYLLAPALRSNVPAEVRIAAQEGLQKHLGRVPDKAYATKLLAEYARRYFDRRQPMVEDMDGLVPVWTWSAADKKLVLLHFPADDASRRFAVRFARDANLISPEDPSVFVLYLTAILENSAYQNGLDQPLTADSSPLMSQLAGLDARWLEQSLALGMASEHAPAATAAIRLIGSKGPADWLLVRNGQPTPLVLANRHSDRRLRLAAAEAVVQMQPSTSFSGASWVVENLGYLAASTGSRRVLLGGSRWEDGQRMVRLLIGLGYEPQLATDGNDLLRKATASPDCEVILVDAAVNRPTADLLVQQLRRDPRTAKTPVGVLARPELLSTAGRVAATNLRTAAFSHPYQEGDLRWQIGRLVELGGSDLMPADERLRQAARALELLAALGTGRNRKIYDLSRVEPVVLVAVNVPTLTTRAVTVLSNFGTPQSQRALVDLASRFTASTAMRQAALDGFGKSVQRFGLQLTTREIQQQYDRYNQSANQDVATQKILGSILDCMEAPVQGLLGKNESKLYSSTAAQ